LLKTYSFAIANRAGQVVFGDPMKGDAITGIEKEKIYTNCAVDDPICSRLPIPLGSHLTYGSDKAGIAKTVEWLTSHV
jgi:Cutinase